MKILKSVAVHLLTGLNVLVIFLLVFQHRIEIPALLMPVGRMHPMVLHFPIVLLLLAFAFECIKRHLPVEPQASFWFIRFLLLAGALSAGFTVIFGLFLSKEDGYTGTLLEWHKWTGAGVFFLSSFSWVVYGSLPAKFGYPVFALTGLLLLGAGHFGASLTHGENFILDPVLTSGKTTPDLANAEVYGNLVVPILQEKCYSCHNPDKAKGGLVMTDTVSLLSGGESGKLFVSGKSEKSLLIERLLLDPDHKHRMPPKGKPQLNDSEIAIIKSWIDLGGDFSRRLDETPESNTLRELATAVYGLQKREAYHFPPADPDLIAGLKNSYRLVVPVAYQSPGLEVSFFGRDHFTVRSLEELQPISGQIVHLNLANMPVGDPELELIAGFPRLRKLNLSHTDITSQGLQTLNKLGELESLVLTGTNISAKALEDLLVSPILKSIFVWNTPVRAEQAYKLSQRHKGVRIEAGLAEEDTTMLQLNSVKLLPENSFFKEPFQLQIRHPVAGSLIYYTLNNLDPDTLTATRFKEPVTIRANTTVKVKAYQNGWLPSEVLEKTYQRSALSPDGFSLGTQPHPLHKAQGVQSLFDLQEGSTDILYASDGKWLGYQLQEIEVSMTFAKPTVVKEVILSTLVSVLLDAFPPARVEIWATGEREDTLKLASIKPEMPVREAKIDRNMILCVLENPAPVTHLKVRIWPVMKMPGWHPRKGKPAWFFIDEILMN